jgi:hypothetical protein
LDHGVTSWLERGDPHNGKVHFNAINGALKKLLAKPKAELAAKGITAELRTFTIHSTARLCNDTSRITKTIS